MPLSVILTCIILSKLYWHQLQMQWVTRCLLSLCSSAVYVLCHALPSPYPYWPLITPKSFSFCDHKDQGHLCDQKRAAHGTRPSLHAILLQFRPLFPAAGKMTRFFLGSGETPRLEVGGACSHPGFGRGCRTQRPQIPSLPHSQLCVRVTLLQHWF